jgi:hypothetical protein
VPAALPEFKGNLAAVESSVESYLYFTREIYLVLTARGYSEVGFSQGSQGALRQ